MTEDDPDESETTEKGPEHGADGPIDDDAEEVDADPPIEPDYDEMNPEYDEAVPDAPDDIDSYGDDGIERPEGEPAKDAGSESDTEEDDGDEEWVGGVVAVRSPLVVGLQDAPRRTPPADHVFW